MCQTNISFHKWRLRLIGAAYASIMLVGLPAIPAQAADTTAPTTTTELEIEFGMRYWTNWGETAKDLYGATRAVLNSRLTYGSLWGNAGEVFGQATDRRYFVKGFAGLGNIGSGNLQDEDFPPGIVPYSSTNSAQRSGPIAYVTIDAGRYFKETPTSRIGALIGYNYFSEEVNAYGCTQTAANPAVCASAFPTSTKVISQNNKWRSLRIGINGDTRMGNWRLSGEAVALPYVVLNGTDSHLLRICTAPGCFTGPIPEDGHGWGYQLQAMLNYQFNPQFDFGLGVRYWHMETKGHTHFEGHVVGVTAIPQPVDWKTTILGVTAQTVMHF